MSAPIDVDVQHRPLNEEEISEIYAEMAKLVTEDDKPVDNLFSEKQMRLLTEPLYATPSFPGGDHPFVAMANVGLFYAMRRPPLVPDVLLSLDVRFPEEVWSKHHRSYFTWLYEKPPDLVIEVVSNTEGQELGTKLTTYAEIGILYYVVFDPQQLLNQGVLRIFELQRRSYVERDSDWFPEIGLGLKLWRGAYEGVEQEWLRWCYEDGEPVPTGAERAEQERLRAEQAQQQAEQERLRAEQAQQQAEQAQQQAEQERLRAEQAQQQAEQERLRAERLAAQLRALGIEPEN
jgi:Uma2 family endonuclease